MKKFISKFTMKSIVGILFILIIPFLLLFNLDTSPRPWHDEGNAMLLARTLVEDGVYSVKTSTGYQSFGAVQSIGPTVILPVALSFKVFGIGIFQGRLVIAIYTFLTLLIIYKLMQDLFNTPTAVLGLLFLLGSASAQFLYFGRQVLGEVPALGFFMGGWYFWWLGRRKSRRVYYGIAGILIGGSMLTKSSYAVITGLLFVALALLDIIYYRQKYLLSLIGTAIVAFIVFSVWILYQRQYFGPETFQQNLALMKQLGQATTGFSISTVAQQVKFLFSSKNDYFYFLWGIPAILYAIILCLRKDEFGFLTSVLTFFTGLWMAYFLYSVPWPSYLFAPAAIVSLFVGKLFFELITIVKPSFEKIAQEIKNGNPTTFSLYAAIFIGSLLLIFYPLQNMVQFNIINKDNAPTQVANFLKNEFDSGTIIETWERELGILTDHQYHYPDQSNLIGVHGTAYRGVQQDYLLGLKYFESVKPSIVVIGWYSKEFQIYDPSFLLSNADLIAEIGEGFTSYEIYKINYPLVYRQ